MVIRINIRRTAEQATSAQIVFSIDDLLQEILLRLPIRSLVRFKSVSKRWLSLISNPRFALLRNPNPNPALGLFLPCTRFRSNPKFEYVNFDLHNPITPPFSILKFAKDPSAGFINIVQSCNGLLLCSSFRTQRPRRNYHVYNPTTKQLTTIPHPRLGRTGPSRGTIHGVSLAFDPAKSPGYKVVCISRSESVSDSCHIMIYSSGTGPWRVSGECFTANHDFKNGIYWNGAVHWLSTGANENSLYFSVDEERFGLMPLPPIPDNSEQERIMTYFGESCGHLHLIETFGRSEIEFSIYEMKRDYSGWFVKYNVNLSAVTSAFPGMIRNDYSPTDFGYYEFSICSLIQSEKEEDAFLILQIPGKAIRYNLVSKTFEKLRDFEGADEEGHLRYYSVGAYQHIESLCCV